MLFCERKVGKILKENWESEVKDNIDLKENKIKEIYERQKSSKTKKKKLELLRECKNTLTEMITDWRMTLVDAEEKNYKTLKEKIVLGRRLEEHKKKERPSPEDDPAELESSDVKKTTLEDDWGDKTPEVENVEVEFEFEIEEKIRRCLTKASNSNPSSKLVKTSEKLRGTSRGIVKMAKKMTPAKRKMSSSARSSPVTKNMVTKLNLMNLPCVKSMAAKLDQDQTQPPDHYIQPARVCGNLANLSKITKPTYVSSSVGVQSRVVQQWTGPPSQWGESRGTRQGSTVPIDQSEQARQQRAGGQKPDCL